MKERILRHVPMPRKPHVTMHKDSCQKTQGWRWAGTLQHDRERRPAKILPASVFLPSLCQRLRPVSSMTNYDSRCTRQPEILPTPGCSNVQKDDDRAQR